MLIYTLSAALRDLDQEDLVVFELSSLISASSENDDTLWYLSFPILVFWRWERIEFRGELRGGIAAQLDSRQTLGLFQQNECQTFAFC
jgi:hypothetical protein